MLFALALGLVVLACGASSGTAERVVMITHPAVPAPTYLDLGDEGDTAGDVRLWHFAVTGPDGAGTVDVIMTTTGINAPSEGLEIRDTRLTFSFKDGADQVIVSGTASYSMGTATVSDRTTRPIIGGSGAYAGTTGWAESIHNADDTWTHTLHVKP